MDEGHPANQDADPPQAGNWAEHIRPLSFPNDEDGLVEVEIAELWELQDRWRHAEARCGHLEAKNRELTIRFKQMRDELLLMSTERKMLLDARSGGS